MVSRRPRWRLHKARLWAVYVLCRILPLRWISSIGAWRGRYRGCKLQTLETRARANLAQIAPNVDVSKALQHLRRESGRALLEVLVADRLAREGCISLQPHPGLYQAMASQRSLVLAMIHHCNLGDVAGAGIGRALPGFRQRYIITRHIEEPTLRAMVQRARDASMRGLKGMVSGPLPGLARQIVKALLTRPPSVVLLHVDEARGEQVWFPLFGKTPPSKGLNAWHAVRIARRARACLVPMVLRRDCTEPTRFSVEVLDVWDPVASELDDQAVFDQMNNLFEAVIREQPANWLNLYHRRP